MSANVHLSLVTAAINSRSLTSSFLLIQSYELQQCFFWANIHLSSRLKKNILHLNWLKFLSSITLFFRDSHKNVIHMWFYMYLCSTVFYTEGVFPVIILTNVVHQGCKVSAKFPDQRHFKNHTKDLNLTQKFGNWKMGTHCSSFSQPWRRKQGHRGSHGLSSP